MGNINPAYYDRIKYELKHKTYGILTITEPIGWRSDEKEYNRNTEYHGIFSKFSNNLKFIGDGAKYINLIYEVYGIEAEIQLKRSERHPHTDLWIKSYDGFLDLSTYVYQNNQVSVKFNSSGLQKILKARENEKIEIERDTTMDGKHIPDLQTQKIKLEGRRIFLNSVFYVDDVDNNAYNSDKTSGQTVGGAVGVPLKVKTKSHENLQDVIPNLEIDDTSSERNGDGRVENMFFLLSDRDRTLHIKIAISFDMQVAIDDMNWQHFWLLLTTYTKHSEFKHKEHRILFDTDKVFSVAKNRIELTYTDTIEVEEGDSLALQFHQRGDGANGHNAHLIINCFNIICDLSIEEDSVFKSSYTKGILAHELGERLSHILTGKPNIFYSDVLGRKEIGYKKDGKASRTGMTHGFWIRGFNKGSDQPENKYQGFTTSFKDYIDSISTVWNLGLGIEDVRGEERIRVEELAYFYNTTTTIKLPHKVSKLKRSIAKEYYYSGLEFGYAKGWENEEAMGLDEYNTRTNFQTNITRIKQNYTKVSKYLAGVYPMEFIRRKPIFNYSTQDHKYDKEIFLLDLYKWRFDTYKPREWYKDFSKKPTGVFSPETATNLRFTPFNIMLRHGWVIAAGLTKYLTESIRYGSSEGNSKLITKAKHQNQYAENGNIVNSELPKALFVPEWIEFEHIVDFEIMEQVEGFTTVDENRIPNFYGLVQFINEDSELEKGYLFNLKPNGSGKWKLLKANI